MKIYKTFILITLFAMGSFVFLPSAHSQTKLTRAELIERVYALMEIVSKLQTLLQLQQAGPALFPASTPTLNFTTELGLGDRGDDVYRLQLFLNRDPDTQLAVSGVGAPGLESSYYGPLTQDAVRRFQIKHKILLGPSGFFLTIGRWDEPTRRKAGELVGTPLPPVVTTRPSGGGSSGGSSGGGGGSSPTNTAPTTNAGSNQTITLPSSVSLSGSAADDGLPSGNLTTAWSKFSGAGTVTFANSSSTSTTATFSQSGTYVLRLTASDGALSDTDDVTITVNAAPAVNTAPVAEAGSNQTITLPTSNVTLLGSATDDGLPDDTLTYAWSKLSGTGTVTFANSSSASTTATFSESDTYVLRLTASDGVLSDTDDVTVTVNSQPVSPDAHTLGPQVVQSTAIGLGTHFASPGGSGTSCSSANPCTIQTAVGQATAGSVVFLRGGTYLLTAQLPLITSGTSSNPVTFESYPGERAIIDGQGNAGTRVKLEANYIVLRNVDVTGMVDSAGVYILNGNNNLIDGVHSYNNRYSGFGIYTPYESYPYAQGSNNIIRNCVAYGNSDVGVEGGSNGGDSDGVSISSGDNNKVLNCLVYGNSDDGIDTWRSTNSEIAYNIIHSNGLGGGDGNGVKAGGVAPSQGTLVHHNISYSNRATGIDQNSGVGLSFFNNVSWGNNYGYTIGSDTVVRNNVSLGDTFTNSGTGITSYNTWNGGFSVSSADFESIDPNSDFFFVLKPGSSLVNAGINVGLPFNGSAPDIGAVESSY